MPTSALVLDDYSRDRNGTCEPMIVGKSKRRIADVDRVVLSLYAKSLTTGEFSAHFADVWGCRCPPTPFGRITVQAVDEMESW